MSAEHLAAICITSFKNAAAAACAAYKSSDAADNTYACCLSVWLCRSESLEAQLKSLLYYFRHHTVEPEILKRLCFVEIVYMLQNHANRYGTVSVVISPVSCLPPVIAVLHLASHRQAQYVVDATKPCQQVWDCVWE